MKRPPLALFCLWLVFCPAYAANASLPRSTPEAEGVESAGVLSLINALEKDIHATHSIMILRHGNVLAEGWWTPYRAEDVHILYSVTKSFTSTAVGFAVAEGRMSINDPVISFFPEFAPAAPSAHWKAMRVRDLLTMSTGHQKDTMDTLRSQTDGQWRRAFFETQPEHRPGIHFVYNSGASYLLSSIVQKVSGQTLDDFLKTRLFEPLGIEHHPWGNSPEGIALGDGGLSISTESLAKFGQLYLQKGMWKGKRLLPEQWVDDATAKQASTGSNPDSNWDHGYGFQFWRNKTNGYRADGALGQLCLILPEYDMVVAVTSGTSDMQGLMNTVWARLLPAVHIARIPDNPAAHDELQRKLRSLSLPVQPGEKISATMAAYSKTNYAFPANEQEISSVEIDFSSENPTIIFKDAEGTHAIACGTGRWLRGSTTFRKRISSLFDVPSQGIAATGAWTDASTFAAKLCFTETPYTITARFKFEGDRLLLDMEHNLRWGETKRPQLIGQRGLAE